MTHKTDNKAHYQTPPILDLDKKYNKEKFLAKNPTLLATVGGVRFYEHPIYGDTAPVCAILPNDECGMTDFWEVPNYDFMTGEFN